MLHNYWRVSIRVLESQFLDTNLLTSLLSANHSTAFSITIEDLRPWPSIKKAPHFSADI